MTIEVLDKNVVAQIAAGEVVERPASVVKELVENALDAGASQVGVEVRGGGTNLIRVTDNGSGIPAEEVELAFERHATSKITGVGDLQSIRSLGFRGEALPSIAAVAQVEMVTCAADEPVGTYLSLDDGRPGGRKNQARPAGTTVAVRHLFRRVPARLKFLKSAATENGHIASTVSQYALAFPEVGFTLQVDGRKTLQTAGRGRLMDSIIAVYGQEVARNMLEVKESDWQGGPAEIRVTGMIGSPAVGRAGRNRLSFFINRRWVSSRLLAWAVEEAYHGLLMAGRHPVAVLNITLSPSEVDVNIHPAKSEVKFQQEHQVFTAVQRAVRQTLVARMPVPGIEEVASGYSGTGVTEPAPWSRVMPGRRPAPPEMEPSQPLVSSLPVLRVLGQLMRRYIVAEGPDGLYLIDQHAAHERIVFEKVRQQAVEVQGLLEPVTIEITPEQEVAWRTHHEDLARFGFSLEPFGARSYLVRAVPHLLHDGDWMGALRDLLGSDEDRGDWVEKIAVAIACHSGAVRSGQILSENEMRELVRQLEQAAVPHACPHGRPTMILLGTGQLAREFGRS
jgi:DNA mismatch repair protein MutL